MIYDDKSSGYYYDVETFLECVDCDHPSDWPSEVYECKRQYAEVYSARQVAKGLLDDFFWENNQKNGRFHNCMNAENIFAWFYESTYEYCDDDWPDPEVEGLEDLDWAIAWFKFWNTGLFRLFGECSWYDVSDYCIGLNVLEGALEKFQRLNHKNHFTYVPDYSKSISLADDIAEALADWETWETEEEAV